MSVPGIPVGASAERSVVVTREMTVAHFHPEMPEAYGTPFMIYLMEVAAAEAIQPYLPPGRPPPDLARFNRRLAAKAAKEPQR